MNGRTRLSDRALVVLLIIFIVLFVRSLALEFMNSRPEPLPPIATVEPEPEQTPEAPVRLRIPAIGIDANVQSLGKNAKGEMDTPKGENRYIEVGWYNLGPRPGEVGSAVIDGHLDTYNLLSPGVFRDLDKLVPGDIVEVIDEAGAIFRFRVVSKAELPSNSDTAAVFGSTDKARLNLITCSGDWQQQVRSYDRRLVVFTELIQ